MFSSGMPTVEASLPWSTRWRYSPWTGMKYLGLTMLSIILSSSLLACPETWISETFSYMTSAPLLYRWFIIVEMAFSWPGMNFDDRMMVSPFVTFICLWLSMAMRVNALMGSPW